ncbi:MAG: prolyl oligopeptidase family serine peptidase [Candidatus Omnitrophota bacterium]
MMKKLLIILIIATVNFITVVSAETIILKSGKSIEGEIVKETDEYIKLETVDGQSLYFYKNIIDTIRGEGEVFVSAVSTESNLRIGLLDYSDKGYMLFVPKNISSFSSVPVLICLPGWGVSAKQDINMWRFPAQKDSFVVINLDVDYKLMKSDSDVEALYQKITNIINSLAEEFPIDTKNMYIAGTSAGGMMAISLALAFPNKFKAVGVVSGGRIGFRAKHNLKNARNCRFYMVHGKLDESIPIKEFYYTKSRLERNGAEIEFNVLPKGAHTLASHVYRDVVDWLSKVK